MTPLRSARPADVDGITDLHTRARTAYYRAGGWSDAGLTSPDACVERREGWASWRGARPTKPTSMPPRWVSYTRSMSVPVCGDRA
ncbi:hypothetical protein AB0L99_13350 [Streptomyces sp. NPDC051954]|uniref:hypothetical protein n=1 Tax=Streptomyces sp. NPDC051954 TaxID=3155524 RepID=UPI003445F69A